MQNSDLKNFFTYSFSLDCVIFGYQNGKIHVLLIKRSIEPYENYWAIPGDLVYPDEDLPNAAERILFDLTRLKNIELHQAQTFGNPTRHPQGRVITNAYFALIRIDEFKAEASSWAEEVQWVPINEVPNLAFDHNLIVNSTYELLKQKLTFEPICFDLLPVRFTLNEFQQLYEFAFEQEMDKANFRKKIKYIPLVAHDEKQQNVKHRPAKLFSFDETLYQEQLKKGVYQFRM
jgi:8-oxo-dGTP diphosphatase